MPFSYREVGIVRVRRTLCHGRLESSHRFVYAGISSNWTGAHGPLFLLGEIFGLPVDLQEEQTNLSSLLGPMPSIAERKAPPPPTAKIKPSFQTLIREHSFQYPSTSKPEFPALQEAVQPHIDAFNAITADNLLEAAIKDIGRKTVFDHKGPENGGRGNKLTFWAEEVQLSKPTLSTRERTSLNRRIYPSEVGCQILVN